MTEWHLDIGATPVAGGVRFRVWAPLASSVDVVRCGNGGEKPSPLARAGEYFQGTITGMAAGDLYWYMVGGTLRRPDPASRCQPAGVHGPSQVVDPDFAWSDGGWQGVKLEELITCELHVGAFTPAGTFKGVMERLDYLCELGVTALELMPVVEFPGRRNWGYDGVFPFAIAMGRKSSSLSSPLAARPAPSVSPSFTANASGSWTLQIKTGGGREAPLQNSSAQETMARTSPLCHSA